MVLITQATSVGSGEPAHPRSLARAFAVCTHAVWKQTKGPNKNQTSSPTGWLRMRLWRISLRRKKSAIIRWDGAIIDLRLCGMSATCFTENFLAAWPRTTLASLHLKTVDQNPSTIMILSFWTDRSGQTVQTQIRLEEQSNRGLHCLQFPLLWMHYSEVKLPCSTFRVITANFLVSEFLGFFYLKLLLEEGKQAYLVSFIAIPFKTSLKG